MADFPYARPNRPVMSSMSLESVFGHLVGANGGSFGLASATWPAANRALFVPFTVASPFWIRRLWWANGATANANIDCGIYTVGGTRLVNTGSTAQAGTSVIQSVSLGTPFLLTPGSYYMALEFSATTGTVIQTAAANADVLRTFGVAQQAVGSLPLPATATLAATASSFLPLFGFTSRTVI